MSHGIPQETPLRAKLRRRLYCTIILFDVLKDTAGEMKTPGSFEASESDEEPREKTFRRFVDKLCEICDSRKRGDTITSAAVLKEPSGVVYVIASNRRTAAELAQVQEFVTLVLTMVRDISSLDGAEFDAKKEELLGRIISFNIDRLRQATKSIHEHSIKCLAALEVDFSNEGMSKTYARSTSDRLIES